MPTFRGQSMKYTMQVGGAIWRILKIAPVLKLSARTGVHHIQPVGMEASHGFGVALDGLLRDLFIPRHGVGKIIGIDEIVAGVSRYDLLEYRPELLRRIGNLSEQEIDVDGHAAVEVGKGVNKQPTLENEVFSVFGLFQSAQGIPPGRKAAGRADSFCRFLQPCF